jgi:hypothetical protein
LSNATRRKKMKMLSGIGVCFATILLNGTIVMAESNKIYFADASNSTFSKMKSIAFAKGFSVRSEPSLSYPEYSGAILRTYDLSLPEIYTFVKKGGNVWLLITGRDIKQNDIFQDLLEISIATEKVTEPLQVVVFNGERLTRLLRNNKLTMIFGNRDYGNCTGCSLGIGCYLVPLKEGEWTVDTISSDETGKARIISAYKKIGAGQLLITSFYNDRGNFQAYFFDNNFIDQLDNEQSVTSALLPWLAGRINY